MKTWTKDMTRARCRGLGDIFEERETSDRVLGIIEDILDMPVSKYTENGSILDRDLKKFIPVQGGRTLHGEIGGNWKISE